MTVMPSPVNRECYDEAIRLGPLLNNMIARIAADHDYLRKTLEETASVDDFTAKLLGLLGTGSKPGTGIEVGVFRHDFFVHDDDGNKPELRMVEMNCIASSFAALGTLTCEMHRFLAHHPVAYSHRFDSKAMPDNDAVGGIADGLAAAHKAYLERYSSVDPSTARIILVGQPGERNVYDQELLRWTLWGKHHVDMVRASLKEIAQDGVVSEDQVLRLPSCEHRPETVASVVYFRAGYSPDDYPSDAEWSARELIETSNAAKCPSVAAQLVGTKKIQQVLDNEGEVERFVDSDDDAKRIRRSFARQYTLSDTDAGAKATKLGIERPDDFVLKPQREGGGNNLYKAELKEALMTMSPAERSAYILMERIRPVVVQNVIARDGQWQQADVVSEFGVYGVYVASGGTVLENSTAGTLLRSKLASQDDGGVAAGVAVLDSPILQ